MKDDMYGRSILPDYLFELTHVADTPDESVHCLYCLTVDATRALVSNVRSSLNTQGIVLGKGRKGEKRVHIYQKHILEP